jgi:hypothetical protein
LVEGERQRGIWGIGEESERRRVEGERSRESDRGRAEEERAREREEREREERERERASECVSHSFPDLPLGSLSNLILDTLLPLGSAAPDLNADRRRRTGSPRYRATTTSAKYTRTLLRTTST